jgi:mono/diheme cytochrome c family protein
MRRQILILSFLLAGAFVSGWLALSRAGGHGSSRTLLTAHVDVAKADAQFRKQVLPLLNKYCWDCHGDGATKGDLALDAFTNATTVLHDRRTWEHVLHNVESGDMPPKKKKAQPTLAERDTITAWIEKTLFPVDPAHPDPGRVTMRRLNRVEYNNTVRDLVGVDFKPADDFPQDDVGYGFDNIGDVLSLPPMLFEKYLRAAERILDDAIVSGPRPPPTRHFGPQQLEGGADMGPIRGLASNGELGAEVYFAQPGNYTLRTKAYGDQAGPDPVKIALRLDGRDVKQFEVKAKANDPKVYETEFKVETAGQKKFSVAFLNDFYNVKTIERKREGKPPKKEQVIEDRNFYCLYLEAVGPLGVESPLPETHKRIFTKEPDGHNDAVFARELIADFTRRAWRRPVTPGETDRLTKLYHEARANGDNFPAAVKHALTAVLVSPHFLFRNEIQPDPNNPSLVSDIDEYALASRLSYFLWSSMPDNELFALAGAGKLRKNLDAQVRRMLRDPKGRALTENFAGQWLQLRLLALIDPDHDKFPDFSEELRRDMRTETEKFFEHIATENRPVTDFLTADYTFVNERLAKHYGLPGVTGEEFRKVSLVGTPRQGLLTQGSILTITSNPNRTSPVKRGKWVLENLLATPPPPPPPNVPPLEAGEKLQGTLRQRMEKHRENAMCASCHSRMDPIGFAFEHFDGVGTYRDKDGTEPVEPAGELATGEKFTDHRQLNQVLATSRRPDFLRCLAEKMLTYALGRGLEYYDKPAVTNIVESLKRGDYKFDALLDAVIHSVPFQQRRGEGDPAQMAASN